ncbi:hypothetical protein CL622_08385 [archaeon]|nr:hypothetical protein [archaeon]|tara:strand:- start:152 stop:655 length:504 start_codon:yes stop_codon:yes gene_type:complete
MLKQKDFGIVAALRKNSRSSLTRLSKTTGVPISTIFDRLKGYRKLVIKKFTCILNLGLLGYSSHAFFVYTICKSKRSRLRAYLLEHPNVNSVYRINHKYDFLIEVVFKDILAQESFVDRTEDLFSVRPKHMFYVVESIAKEKFMTDMRLFKDRRRISQEVNKRIDAF